MKAKTIQTMSCAERIIEKCGGIRALAEMLKDHPSVIHGWKKRGYVPARRQPEVLIVARENGINLHPDDFFNLEAIECDPRKQ